MTGNLDLIRPAYAGMVWPALPPEPGALALALQFQLGESQWLAPEALRSAQFRQLGALITHARDTVPFYRERLAGARWQSGQGIDEAWFYSLPLLTRADVQTAGDALHSRAVPTTHQPVGAGQTSGSTGAPVTYLETAVTRVFWRAFNLRNQLWRRRDLSLKLVAIRPDRGVQGEEGAVFPGWGPATGDAYRDGPSALLHSANTVERQLEWLAAQDPAYLLTLGTNLLELAREMHRRGMRLPRLREAETYGDALSQEARDECRALLGVQVADMYTAAEAGYIALHCPDQDQYHVQSENLLVEILNENGRPCRAGETGRVVLTTLHNFAMPLVRYDIGDYAEPGAPCACGRGLPVLRRVVGRERNMALTPDGRKFHASFAAGKWMHVAPIRQMQLVQKTLAAIEVRVVAPRPLTRAEEEMLSATLLQSLGYPYEMTVVRVENIPRSAAGKFEDFIREV